jgi:S1-C subfamily serine protease
MSDWDEDAEFGSATELFREGISMSRLGEPALLDGTYYVDIVYQSDDPPIVGKKEIDAIPFTLRATAVRTRIDGMLHPGERLKSHTDNSDGSFRTFTVDVPAGAKALRIDLDDTDQDMDILARRGAQIVAADNIDANATSPLGRESLLLTATSTPKLAPGRWFLNVHDFSGNKGAPFTIYVSLDSSPPLPLLSLLRFPRVSTPIQNAVQSAVAIVGDAGSGSGTFLTRDGLILTNHHVIEKLAGGVAEPGELVIGITIDQRRPPVEMFRARVVAADPELDLALIEAFSGLYGQSIPNDYRFPFVEIGRSDSLALGSPLTLIGFPTIGGMGSRPGVTASRGIVGGFEYYGDNLLIKTDADIAPGNSGGAAVDETGTLIGVPTSVNFDSTVSGQIGYVRSIGLIPDDWRELIRSRNQN